MILQHPINALMRRRQRKRCGTLLRLRRPRRSIRHQHQARLLNRLDQRGDGVEKLCAARQTHEVVGAGDADGLLDGDGGAARAGVRFGAEVVAQDDWICGEKRM